MTAPKANWNGGTMSRLETAHLGGTCRVCALPVEARTPAWMVPWVLGLAHEACGWLRPEEYAVHVVEADRSRWWCWRCPTCGQDATRTSPPREGDPMECRRCYAPALAVGSLVEARAVGLRAIAGKQQRSAYVWPGDRGLVRTVDGERLVVDWERTEKRGPAATRANATEVRVIR
jgi:hypothetical protein